MSAKAGTTLTDLLLALTLVAACELLTIPFVIPPDLSPGRFIAQVLPLQARAMGEGREQTAQIDGGQTGRIRIHYNRKGRIDQARTVCFSRRCLVMELAGGRIVEK